MTDDVLDPNTHLRVMVQPIGADGQPVSGPLVVARTGSNPRGRYAVHFHHDMPGMTMADGSLLRFDSSASVPAEKLLQMAYTATRSERVEVSCNDAGAVGYEKHDPV